MQDRAVATRHTILTAAAELIIERGYGGASISQITARAGVAAGAVYFHFRSKEGIAHALLSLDLAEGLPPRRGPALQEWSDLALLLARRLDSDPTVRAAPYLAALADSQDGWTSPWPAWRARAARPLHAAARAGELQAHVQPDAVAELLISAWAGMAGHRTAGTAEQQMRTFLSCCLPGIATPAVAARLEPAPGLTPWSGPGPAETAA
ncbi:TetR family transcriptional regulator [Streptomyces rimosus]|uniref:TetR/AcrR family transcriptional regulator n=1 Tax=Streptomyces rimosus TaxID=1927 RepID=UPI00067A92CE|nr:TetR/AcrR family transcriptional regulator [Streptomyces rimosus]